MRRAVVLALVAVIVVVCATIATSAFRSKSHPATTVKPAAGTAPSSTEASLEQDTMGTGFVETPSAQPEAVGKLMIEGQVIDQDEAPVGGAIVSLSTHPLRTVTTGADGVFKFDALADKTYDLFARFEESAAGPLTVRPDPSTGPLTVRLQSAASILLSVIDDASGKPLPEANVRVAGLPPLEIVRGDPSAPLKLRPVPAGGYELVASCPGYAETRALVTTATAGDRSVREIRMQRGAAAAGTVVGEDGRLVANAQVRLVPADATPLFSSQSAVRADESGHFEFAAVPRGGYRVTAEHPDGGYGATPRLTFDGVTAASDITIRLSREGVLEGSVVSGDHVAVPSATVIATRPESAGTRRVTCDEQGRFRLSGLGRGSVRLVALSGASQSAPLDVTVTRDASRVTIVLDAEAVIEGDVVTSSGALASDVQVAAVPEAGATSSVASAGSLGMNATLADPGGHFVLHGLSPGVYRLRASRQGAANSPEFWMRNGTAVTTGSRDVRLVMEDDGCIVGRATVSGGAAAVDVQASVLGGSTASHSTEDGSFKLCGVPPGRRSVTVRGSNGAPKFVDDVLVQAAQTTDVGTVALDPLRTVRGHVHDVDGSPGAGASVTIAAVMTMAGNQVLPPDMGTIGRMDVTTDADGSFAISGAPLVPLMLQASLAGVGKSAPVSIPPGDSVDGVELTLQPTGSIQGRVLRDGAPFAGATVVATTLQASRARVMTTSDDSGQYRFDDLPPAAYVVIGASTEDPNHISARVESVRLSPGDSGHQDLELPTGGAVSINLLDSRTAQPIAAGQAYLATGGVSASSAGQLEYELLARGPGLTFISTVASGAPARFDDVPAGPYSLCVVVVGTALTNSAARAKVSRDAATLPVVCQPIAVPGGSAQSLTLTIR